MTMVTLLQRHVELLGHDLRERGADAHARLDLADRRGDRAVGRDAQPRIERLGIEAAGHDEPGAGRTGAGAAADGATAQPGR
jgi:hypothetical protein